MSKGKNVPQGMSLTTKVMIAALSLAVAGGVATLGVHFASSHTSAETTPTPTASGRYPAGAEAGFLAQCEKAGSATLCGCVLHALEARFTFAQFQDFVSTFSRTQALPSGAVAALSTCTHSASPSPSCT